MRFSSNEVNSKFTSCYYNAKSYFLNINDHNFMTLFTKTQYIMILKYVLLNRNQNNDTILI